MACRLSEYVVRGELNNTKNYSTFGRLEIVGIETPLMVELTGNMSEDLLGKRIYFEVSPPPAASAGRPPKLAQHLIGVTGTMTAAGWVKTFDCPPAEFLRRAKLGEAPPTRWQRRLHLEFYSQHGRTLIELAGPVLEYHAGQGDREDWRPWPESTPPPDEETERELDERARAEGPGIAIIHPTGEVEQIEPGEYPAAEGPIREMAELQRRLDAQAAAMDRAIGGAGGETDDDADSTLAEMELMDHLITHERGDPLSLAFETVRRLPRADDLPEKRVEPLLKGLLAELARRGVALHVCEHFSPRDTYRLLVEKIFTEWTFHPQLSGTGWVQNYMTSEYCEKCIEAAEGEGT